MVKFPFFLTFEVAKFTFFLICHSMLKDVHTSDESPQGVTPRASCSRWCHRQWQSWYASWPLWKTIGTGAEGNSRVMSSLDKTHTIGMLHHPHRRCRISSRQPLPGVSLRDKNACIASTVPPSAVPHLMLKDTCVYASLRASHCEHRAGTWCHRE